MKATRDGFGDSLVEIGKNNENIIVLSADLSKATKTTKFANRFPERFVECGIAECNAIGIASGLSEHDYYPIFSSFASFLTGKYDVIRVSAAYSNASMLLVGTHAGLAIGKDGVTQMGLEDVTLMRSLPNMKVYQPATYNQCLNMIPKIINQKGPSYLRLGRQPVEEIFSSDDDIELGKLQNIQGSPNSDICILASGCILVDAVKASKKITEKGFDVAILNVHTIKPFDIQTLLKYARGNIKSFVTVEDHTVTGGLGSLVAETLSRHEPKKLLTIGLKDIFPESGAPKDLYSKYQLDALGIEKQIIEFLGEK